MTAIHESGVTGDGMAWRSRKRRTELKQRRSWMDRFGLFGHMFVPAFASVSIMWMMFLHNEITERPH